MKGLSMTETKAKYKVKLPKELEEDIQAKIVQFLTMEGWTVFEFAKPRSRPLCPRCGAVVGQLAGGVPEAWPDILAINQDDLMAGGDQNHLPTYLQLEVKRQGGKRSRAQIAMHARLDELGVLIWIVESVEEVASILRDRLGCTLRTGI